MNRILFTVRTGVISLCAVACTVMATYAGISMRSSDVCPVGMVQVPAARTFACVDIYESSPQASCPYQDVSSQVDTVANLSVTSCGAESKVAAIPWRFVTREQAAALCARAGKRLPDAAEWYALAVGGSAHTCNNSSGAVMRTGESGQCLSPAGVFDAVGNVWEWVTDDIWEGQYQGRPLPESGHVIQVDSGGVAVYTTDEKTATSTGYLWSTKERVTGMVRGGFYGVRDDADVLTIQANVAPDFSGQAVGFRCVR